MSDDLKQNALDYHRYPKPGKLEIKATKQLANQRDLGLAYSPGVAAACEEIVRDPLNAALYTSRSNLVAVITNGTAVLGLGAIGSLASKPVMEGKAVLFKQFADIDVFDIEVNELDPERFIETVARLEPTFGGINLEDIKAPDCFIIERALKERMGIPVFHDDQHGTAIVVSAAITNALRVVGKDISQVRLVTAGAGAAALACLDLLVTLGLKPEHIIVTDIVGVVYQGRVEVMDPYKGRYAVATDLRTLEQALVGRRCVPGAVRRWGAEARVADEHGASARSSWRSPTPTRRSCRTLRAPPARTPSSPPGARTFRIRSTTSCVSHSSSAARWTAGRPRSTRR